jgi:DNA-binding NtrC family response regulator
VRELENAVERAVVLSTEPMLGPAYFPTLRRAAETVSSPDGEGSRVSIPGSTMAELEREAILRTMEAVGGSTSRAAELLQISPRKIQYKLKEYHQEDAIRG